MPDPTEDTSVFDTQGAILFRFLPVWILGLFSDLWFNADLFYRATQPLAAIDGASPPRKNILLDYSTSIPILITIKAALNGHWRVALFSLHSLRGNIPPVIAARIFSSNLSASGYRLTIQPANFWFCFAVLVIYLFTIPLVRPTPAYRLPRVVVNISDLLSYCYASRILGNEILGRPIFSVQERIDEKLHLESKVHLAKQNYRFGFYLGKDGNRHIGFDVTERQNFLGYIELVDNVEPGKATFS